MMILKMALAVACAVGSTAATAAVANAPTKAGASNTSHCHYEGTVIMPDGAYDVYYCHYVGDGWY